MSKPEDIPQDVWDAAEGHFDQFLLYPQDTYRPAVQIIARAMIAASQARALSSGEGWQDIATAPRDGTLILLGRKDDPDWPLRCRRWQDTHWRGWDAEDATHWQPLPQPPSKDKRHEQ